MKQTVALTPNEQTIINALPSMPLNQIADTIRRDWRARGTIYFGAVPYLDAMECLLDIKQDYGADSGVSVVLYFLSNANTYRGPVARAVKAELNKRAKAA